MALSALALFATTGAWAGSMKSSTKTFQATVTGSAAPAVATPVISGDAEFTDAARKAYDALTPEQKALVSNYATLTTAETKCFEAEMLTLGFVIDSPRPSLAG